MSTSYRALRALTRYGSWLAAALGLAIWAATGWAVMHGFVGPLGVVVGLVVGLLVAYFVQVLVELARLISEMLLPR